MFNWIAILFLVAGINASAECGYVSSPISAKQAVAKLRGVEGLYIGVGFDEIVDQKTGRKLAARFAVDVSGDTLNVGYIVYEGLNGEKLLWFPVDEFVPGKARFSRPIAALDGAILVENLENKNGVETCTTRLFKFEHEGLEFSQAIVTKQAGVSYRAFRGRTFFRKAQ